MEILEISDKFKILARNCTFRWCFVDDTTGGYLCDATCREVLNCLLYDAYFDKDQVQYETQYGSSKLWKNVVDKAPFTFGILMSASSLDNLQKNLDILRDIETKCNIPPLKLTNYPSLNPNFSFIGVELNEFWLKSIFLTNALTIILRDLAIRDYNEVDHTMEFYLKKHRPQLFLTDSDYISMPKSAYNYDISVFFKNPDYIFSENPMTGLYDDLWIMDYTKKSAITTTHPDFIKITNDFKEKLDKLKATKEVSFSPLSYRNEFHPYKGKSYCYHVGLRNVGYNFDSLVRGGLGHICTPMSKLGLDWIIKYLEITRKDRKNEVKKGEY